jgi:O-antigen/teichoic acid export membrane protein
MFYSRIINGTQQLLVGLLSISIVSNGFEATGLLFLTSSLSILSYVSSKWSLHHISKNQITTPNNKQDQKHKELNGIYLSSYSFGIMNTGSTMVGVAQIPIIALTIGPEMAAIMYVLLKIIFVFNTFILQYTTTQLPIFTKMCAEGYWGNASELMRSTILIGSAMFVILGLLFPLVTPYILKYWVGPNAEIDFIVLLLLALNFSISGPLALMAQFVLASGKNVFVYSTLIHGLTSIVGLFILGDKYGPISIPISAMIGLGLTNFWINPVRAKSLDTELKSKLTTAQRDSINEH